jgi:hypothetical protein
LGRARIRHRLILLVALSALPRPAGAQWSGNGNGICIAAGDQGLPATAGDGAGGAFIVWEDNRPGSNGTDLYLQRVTASGALAPGWTANGIPLCVAANEQRSAAIVADGAGGVFVAWEDLRAAGVSDIYLQRISSSGALVAGWPVDGLPVCAAAGDQTAPVLEQESGSVIVAWRDERAATADIYAQQVSGAGLIQWVEGGVPVCAATGFQSAPTIVGDKNGGAIVAWEDKRSGFTADIYAQRLNPSGNPQWTLDGIAVCDSLNDQTSPHAIPDGSGGAIVVWDDYRANDSNIFAQRLSGAGVPQWAPGGVALCAAAGEQYSGIPVSDGAGGAIVPWIDFRFTAATLFAQKISAAGALGWALNGLAVCTTGDISDTPVASPDGTGGAFFVWDDDARSSTVDLYAVRITAGGAVGSGWSAAGNSICNSASNQILPVVTTDGTGSLIASWIDARNGNNDIYAKRLGQTPTVDVPFETPSGIALAAAPNPMTTQAWFRFSLPAPERAGLQLLDVTGRVIRTLLEEQELPAGEHAALWDGKDGAGALAPAGLYFARLVTATHTDVRPLARLR